MSEGRLRVVLSISEGYICGFRLFPSSCPLRTSHFRYVTYSEVAGDLHAQSRFGRGLGFGFGLGLGLGFEP